MDVLLIATRAAHFAAQISLAGIFGFVVLIATPAYARMHTTIPAKLRRQLSLGAWASLAVVLVSGAFWLALVSRSMSARPFADLWAQGVVTTVATRTQFGHAWILRVILLVLLIPFTAALGKRRGFDALAATFGAALLAATAWQGHAGAEEGLQGFIHLFADGAHLIAAGGWIGTLVPLALLLAQARRLGDRDSVTVARFATIAFSDLGLSCVGALFVTGAFNAWLLVGTVAALVGTLYGQLLLAKIALFAIMIALAAFNRFRLLPRLAATDHGRKANESRVALARIQRNAVIEALIGLVVIGVVAALGTQVPGAHQEPWWPFPYRFGLDAVEAVPALRSDAIATTLLALLGLILLGFGWRRRHAIAIATGAVLFIGLGWRPIELLMIGATPTSYYTSPEAFTAPSIIAGGKVYVANCVACHGKEGRGDGPLAATLPVAPADLTAHLFAHREGDLLWFISKGMENGVMPAFERTIDETARWDVINFLSARAAGDAAVALGAAVTTASAPLAPDFALPVARERSTTLKALLRRGAVLLAFDTTPTSALSALFESWRSVLAENGVTILVITDQPELRVVYGLYDSGTSSSSSSVAFLIDRDGYIRARWHPGDAPDWQNLETLTREIAAMSRLKLAPAATIIHLHQGN